MATERHLELIDQLRASADGSWGSVTLLRCLERLRDGGVTQWRSIDVDDAWWDDRSLHVVYHWNDVVPPYDRPLGIRATAESSANQMETWLYFPGAYDEGAELADFNIAEPLGEVWDHLRIDADGIAWWGEPPLAE